jgi:hypothetical protein
MVTGAGAYDPSGTFFQGKGTYLIEGPSNFIRPYPM